MKEDDDNDYHNNKKFNDQQLAKSDLSSADEMNLECFLIII